MIVVLDLRVLFVYYMLLADIFIRKEIKNIGFCFINIVAFDLWFSQCNYSFFLYHIDFAIIYLHS